MKSTSLLVAAALAALLIASAPLPHVRAQAAGDADCDGVIDEADLAALLDALFRGSTCAGADANLDGSISNADVLAFTSILAAAAEATATVTPPPAMQTSTPAPTSSTPTEATLTATPTLARTPTLTGPPSPSATVTRTFTGSFGNTTRTATRSPSTTRTPSQTRTSVPTRTLTFTRTVPPTRTETRTPTARPTTTATRTGTDTRTPTVTGTPTSTATRTKTRTQTRTMTATSTRVSTFTPTVPPTRTATRTRTATIELPAGPLITYFGVARADGRPQEPIGTTAEGVPIYSRIVPSGFLVVVEARRGRTPAPVGTSRFDSDAENPGARPDLQIQSNRPLGNGSAAICDRGFGEGEAIGGVPGINPPSFAVTQAISDALNDFGCRFDFHVSSDDACTKNALGNFSFVSGLTQTQFCSVPAIGVELTFPSGDTELTVQVRNTAGTAGNQARMIVRTR